MRRIINITLMATSLLLVLGLILTISANTNESRHDRKKSGVDINLSKEEIPRLVEIIKIWKLVDELGLNEKQLVEFLPRFEELDKTRSAYYKNRRELINKLDDLLKFEEPEKQVKLAFDEFINTEAEYYQKYRDLRELLYSGLTIKQRAKYIVFEDKYRRDMGSLIKKLRDLSDLRESQKKSQPEGMKQSVN